jgi:PadR family transcriptional regulator
MTSSHESGIFYGKIIELDTQIYLYYNVVVIEWMENMKLLSRAEETLLLTIWRLQDDAYGVPIRDSIGETTGKLWSFGALYISLDRLEKKGFLESYFSEPTKTRGGRRKRIYRLKPSAFEALSQIRKIEKAIWSDIPDFETAKVS